MRYFRNITPHLFCGYKLTRQNPRVQYGPTSPLFLSSTLSTSPPSQKVSKMVDEVSNLTLLEVSDLTEVLRKKFNIESMPVMTVIFPGMDIKRGQKGAGPSKGAEEKKEEQTAFDLKLEGYEAAAKIKVIKEVRAFTDLGLKEAKDLVEKAPTLLKKGVTKEEAEKIVEKMKEVGAKVSMV